MMWRYYRIDQVTMMVSQLARGIIDSSRMALRNLIWQKSAYLHCNS